MKYDQEYLNELKECLSYDPVTGLLTWKKSIGQNVRTDQQAGYLNPRGYIQIQFKGKNHRAHRLAWYLHYGTCPKDQLDHVNGNRSDNRIENLREASNRENSQNRILHRDGRLFGCCFHKARKKWQAQIKINGKTKHIGYFNTELEAHEAYKKYLLKQSL